MSISDNKLDGSGLATTIEATDKELDTFDSRVSEERAITRNPLIILHRIVVNREKLYEETPKRRLSLRVTKGLAPKRLMY